MRSSIEIIEISGRSLDGTESVYLGEFLLTGDDDSMQEIAMFLEDLIERRLGR